MDILHAPWRANYTESVARKNESNSACVFCVKNNNSEQDNEQMILARYSHCYVIMNKYPYNGGHLLIIPHEHKESLTDLPLVTLQQMTEVAQHATQLLHKVVNQQGVNIGINSGKAAGAGIPEHLHMHILPRWTGDTNFLPTLADTKIVAVDTQQIYSKLKPLFENLSLNTR